MPSLFSAVTLATLALSAVARPAPSPTREQRRSTPEAKLPTPEYKLDADISARIAQMAAAAKASAAVKAKRAALDFDTGVDLQRRELGDTLIERQSACLDSTANDTTISALFYYGGEGTTVELCPGANIKLTNAVFFSAANQVLTTQGNPTDDTRATLTVTGSDQSCAIYGACIGCDNISIQNIQVDGNREGMGIYPGGIGLVEIGGTNSVGHTVKDCHIFEPRGWSALHIAEGEALSCKGAQILNNQVGPSGHSPTNGYQFRKRDDTVYAPGQWADGISLSCASSTVTGNTVTDATDGGIVIFGSPDSTISGNTIIAQERRPLGGINLVDYLPWGGGYSGVVVEGNTLVADTNMIKIGIAIGGMSWGSDNRTAARTSLGTVRNNVFKSGASGYFGYAISVAGHEGATVTGNDASGANFGGEPSVACIPVPAVPAPQAFVYDQWTTPQTTLQSNFNDNALVFLICQEPSAGPLSSGVAAAAGTFISGSQSVVANVSSSTTSSSTTTTTTTTTSSTTTTTTTTTVAPKTTTTTTTQPKTTTTTKAQSTRLKWYAAPVKTTTTKKTTTTTTTTAKGAANTRKATWFLAPYAKRNTAAGERHIIQDGDVLDKRAAPAIGAAKATPVAALVNPFAVLEQHRRLR
ncbi:hypothetical protein JCM8097_009371 [Rhodosporidiobolus ruineniae]